MSAEVDCVDSEFFGWELVKCKCGSSEQNHLVNKERLRTVFICVGCKKVVSEGSITLDKTKNNSSVTP